jgi:hypothetical protein
VSTYTTHMQAMVAIIKTIGSDLVLLTAGPSNGKDFSTYTPGRRSP